MNPTTGEIRIAAAIIRDDCGRSLVVRKAGTDIFMQPGGKIEPGEDAAAAMAREVFEELGVRPLNPTYVGCFSAPAANEAGHVVVADVFSASFDGEPVPAAEIAELAWFDPQNPSDLNIAPLSRLLLRETPAIEPGTI